MEVNAIVEVMLASTKASRVRGHGFTQGMASHTSRISLYMSFMICLNINMFHKCFKVDERNMLTPFSHSVNHMHFGAKMLKIFKSKLTKNIIFIRSRTTVAICPNLDLKSFMSLFCSFLGIQNMQISYSLPIKWMQKFLHAKGSDFCTEIL